MDSADSGPTCCDVVWIPVILIGILVLELNSSAWIFNDVAWTFYDSGWICYDLCVGYVVIWHGCCSVWSFNDSVWILMIQGGMSMIRHGCL